MTQKSETIQKANTKDYELVEKALQFIQDNKNQQPSLTRIAAAIGLNEFTFQKLFSRWVGISPKRFLQFLTKEYAKKLLDHRENILDVTYDSGLSSPGRLHDLFVHCEAMTPGEYKNKGQGIQIKYGFCDSPFGSCMIAKTQQGICNLKFVQKNTQKYNTKTQIIDWLRQQWPKAELKPDGMAINQLSQTVFPLDYHSNKPPLHLYIRGTNFQIKVWEALTRIPFGCAVSYGQLAAHIQSPGACRAVGTAVGKNPLPFIIPCHRVIRKMGILGNYGEGPARKKALIGWEAAKKRTKI